MRDDLLSELQLQECAERTGLLNYTANLLAEARQAIEGLVRERYAGFSAVKRAMEQAERFERLWYLRGDELEKAAKEKDELRAAIITLALQQP